MDQNSSSLIFIFRGYFISSLFYKRRSPWWSQKDVHSLCPVFSGEKVRVVIVPKNKGYSSDIAAMGSGVVISWNAKVLG